MPEKIKILEGMSIQNWSPSDESEEGIYVFEGEEKTIHGPFTWLEIKDGEIVAHLEK